MCQPAPRRVRARLEPSRKTLEFGVGRLACRMLNGPTMRARKSGLRALALVVASLGVWACSANESPTDTASGNAAGSPADAGEGGSAPGGDNTGNAAPAGAGQNAMGGSGDAGRSGCVEVTHSISDLCDSPRNPCPMHADAHRERALCQLPDNPGTRAVASEVDRFETTCGGFVFIEKYDFGSEAWEYDANSELVSASPIGSDVAVECPPPAFFGAEPCPHVSETPKLLCKDQESFAGASSGGAGGG